MDDLLYQVMIELDGAQMIQEEEHRFSIRFDAAKAEITILTDRAVPSSSRHLISAVKKAKCFGGITGKYRPD